MYCVQGLRICGKRSCYTQAYVPRIPLRSARQKHRQRPEGYLQAHHDREVPAATSKTHRPAGHETPQTAIW